MGQQHPQRAPANWRSYAINSGLVLASLMVGVLAIEVGSWIWVEHLRPKHLTQWEFRATQPPPYHDASYFSEAFLEESRSSIAGTVGDIVELRDFSGRYFNVRGGFRATTDTPQNPTRRVLMFGGSTLFSQEVPDDHTIASYLQRLLNAEGVRWEVRNYGLPGMNSRQQTLILHRTQLRPGDIVVHYHGVNDIYYTVFGGSREGWVQGVPAVRPVQKLSPLHRQLYALHQRFSDHSYAAEVALDVFNRAKPSTITDAHALARNAEIAVEVFRENVAAAAAHASQAGAEFVHFLQPQVFANSQLTPYESELVANPLGTAPGVETAFRHGYPLLQQAGEELARQGIAFFDIADTLDRRPAGEEVFLDFCHVNHRGNELIAGRMMDVYFRGRIAR
jgi:hypothetical protein